MDEGNQIITDLRISGVKYEKLNNTKEEEEKNYNYTNFTCNKSSSLFYNISFSPPLVLIISINLFINDKHLHGSVLKNCTKEDCQEASPKM